MKLELILGADALRAPLTGIGRYTYELARRLVQHEEIARLRYFSMGKWIEDPLAALASPNTEVAVGTTPELNLSLIHI